MARVDARPFALNRVGLRDEVGRVTADEHSMPDWVVEPSEARLPFCPRCQYSLQGHAAADGRCPECGLTFDADSRMWLAGRKGSLSEYSIRFYAGIVNLCFGGLMIVFTIVYSRAVSWGWHGFAVLASFNLATGILSLWLWHDRRFRRKAFVAVLPSGLWFRNQFNRVRWYSWNKIDCAKDWRDRTFRSSMSISWSRKTILLTHECFVNEVEVREAIDAVARRVAVKSGKGSTE